MKKKLYLILAAAMAVALLMTTVVAAAGYDTTNDPLIVYSGLIKWAEETFRPSINKTITSTVDPLKLQLADALTRLEAAEKKIAELTNQPSSGGTTTGGATNSYTVVYLTEGTELLATSVCSIILRSGKANVVSPFDAQGLTDITDATELLNGAPLTINHEVIVPRGNDGRGIRITSAGGAYLLVQGGYTLEP